MMDKECAMLTLQLKTLLEKKTFHLSFLLITFLSPSLYLISLCQHSCYYSRSQAGHKRVTVKSSVTLKCCTRQPPWFSPPFCHTHKHKHTGHKFLSPYTFPSQRCNENISHLTSLLSTIVKHPRNTP